MSNSQQVKVAVVTGSNRGLGFAMVKRLLQELQPGRWIVYMTARNNDKGRAALIEVINETNDFANVFPLFYQLDIDVVESIENFKRYIAENHTNGIDVLINNAGIYPKSRDADRTEAEGHFRFNMNNIRKTIETNFFGTLNVCRILTPVLSKHCRIVNLGSGMASVIFKYLSPSVQDCIENDITNMDQCEMLMKKFVSMSESNLNEGCLLSTSAGYEIWPNFAVGDLLAYGFSKIGIAMLTQCLQKEFINDGKDGIVINCCCPGSVNTDLNPFGTISPDEGSKVPMALAILPENTDFKGQFIAEYQVQTPYRYQPNW